MAFTANGMSPTVFGNMRVVCGILTSTGNGTADGLGMDYIAGFCATQKSHTTTLDAKFAISGSGLVCISASTGSDFYILAWGK